MVKDYLPKTNKRINHRPQSGRLRQHERKLFWSDGCISVATVLMEQIATTTRISMCTCVDLQCIYFLAETVIGHKNAQGVQFCFG